MKKKMINLILSWVGYQDDLSFSERMYIVSKLFSNSTLDWDNHGQYVIYTGVYNADLSECAKEIEEVP